jgi:LPS export ABC transporter permease LptF/LPS export ABC transporter permease LptG
VPKLFDRYIIKEIIPPFGIGLLLYSFVLLMNQILRLSEDFIARGVSLQTVIALLVYLIPSVLAFTIPMSVLMAILAGLSRLSSDVEITAFKTLGISYKRLLRPILVFSFFGWLVTSFLTLYLAPQANYKWVQAISRSVLTNVQFHIQPREFNESLADSVIFIQDISQEKEWENIFVYLADDPEIPRVIYAKRGGLKFYPEERRAILELFDGALHSYPLSTPEKYSVTVFEHLEEEMNVGDLLSSISEEKRVREKDIGELTRDVGIIKEDLEELSLSEDNVSAYRQKKRDFTMHWIEIHKKFSIPFACIIFALLGLPLGASTKKGGRASGFTVSIALIMLYYILLTAGEQMAVEGKISPLIGMWGPNVLFLLLGLYFFAKALKESSPFSFLARFLGRKNQTPSQAREKRQKSRWPRLSLRFPNILDRYIIRKYLTIFFLVFLSLISIFLIVTFFERIDNIYKHDKPLSMFFEFLWYSVPEFVHFSLPVSVLVSTLLCLGFLTKFNEITAIKASGISLYRIMLPILILACMVSFVSFYLQENILPYSNKKAEATWSRINDSPPRSYSYIDRRWVMGMNKDRIYHYRYFDADASAFSQISIFDLDQTDWRIKRRYYSEKAVMGSPGFLLEDSWIREFEGDKPVNFEKKERIELAAEEDKGYFLKEWKEPDQMSYAELSHYIKEIEEREFETTNFKVDLNYKVSFPLASLIVALLGIPFAFSMGKRGALVGIGLSIVIAMIYWGAIGIFKSLGYANYLNAFLAAWGPNLIFGLAGLYLLFTVRT